MQANANSIVVSSAWVDIAVANGLASLTGVVLSNEGAYPVNIFLGGAAAPTTEVGVAIQPGEDYEISAGNTHIWVKAFYKNSSLAVSTGNTTGGGGGGGTVGQATMAASAPVTVASDQTPLTVGGISAVATATFNRDANTSPYAFGQHVTNAAKGAMALAVARVNGGTGIIRRVRLSTNKPTNTGVEAFRIHFFKTAPGTIPNDLAAFSAGVSGIAAIYLGKCDVVLENLFTDGAKGIGVPNTGSEILFDAAGGSQNIYALIEARGAYTPTSGETFTLAVEVMRD